MSKVGVTEPDPFPKRLRGNTSSAARLPALHPRTTNVTFADLLPGNPETVSGMPHFHISLIRPLSRYPIALNLVIFGKRTSVSEISQVGSILSYGVFDEEKFLAAIPTLFALECGFGRESRGPHTIC